MKMSEYKEFSEDIGIRAKTERLRVLDGTSELTYNSEQRVNKWISEQSRRVREAKKQMADMPKNISSGQQGKHIRGSVNFDETRSELTYDPQKLIDLYADSAEPILDSKGKWTSKSRFEHTESIGISRSGEQVGIETNAGIIHYSKKGIHIVPARPAEKKG